MNVLVAVEGQVRFMLIIAAEIRHGADKVVLVPLG